MKYTLIILAFVINCSASDFLMQTSNGRITADVTGQKLKFIGTEVRGHGFRLNVNKTSLVQCDNIEFDHSEPLYLSDLQNVTTNFPITEVKYKAHKQSSKSDLHKTADNAMIATLIMGGLMTTGTVSLAEGTTDAITMQLLTIEMADPTNALVQVIGTKLDKIKTIIMNAGGTADDAIVHVLPGE